MHCDVAATLKILPVSALSSGQSGCIVAAACHMRWERTNAALTWPGCGRDRTVDNCIFCGRFERCWAAGCRMGTCEEMAGALEERMRWVAGATEAADKAKAAAEASVEAAKTALKSEPDPRGGTQVCHDSTAPARADKVPCRNDPCISRASLFCSCLEVSSEA